MKASIILTYDLWSCEKPGGHDDAIRTILGLLILCLDDTHCIEAWCAWKGCEITAWESYQFCYYLFVKCVMDYVVNWMNLSFSSIL